MTIIIAIAAVIAVGAFFLLRSPPPSAEVAAMTDADKTALRDDVLHRLQERLVGWTFETPADKLLEISARETGSERLVVMTLNQLSESWFPLHSTRRISDADEIIESFVAGVTGQGEGSDDEADESGLRSALSLRLVTTERIPKSGLSRPAGSLAAVLVLRQPGGPELVTTEDLATMKLSEAEAFGLAFENLKADVDEGLAIESLGDSEPPDAIAVAPTDALAASYALVPALAARVRKALGNRDAQLFLDTDGLVAAVVGVEIERDKPMLPDAVASDEFAWKSVPG